MSGTDLSLVKKMPNAQAAKIVRRVISSYPSINAVELAGYLTELAMLVARYPEPVANRAISLAMRASPTFPPTIPQVAEQLAELASSASYAHDWEMHSQQQLLERAQREAEEIEEPLDYRRAVAA